MHMRYGLQVNNCLCDRVLLKHQVCSSYIGLICCAVEGLLDRQLMKRNKAAIETRRNELRLTFIEGNLSTLPDAEAVFP
jgi:hypothetical protein